MIYQCRECNRKFEANERLEQCPLCKNKYYDKPDVERKLFTLQDSYYDNFNNADSQKYLTEMIIEIEEIARNSFISILRRKGTFVSREELEDMTNDVVIKMLTYFRRPVFRIEGSFVGYINQVILYPLYNDKKKEKEHKEISLYTTVKTNSEGKKMTLEDKLKKQNAGYIYSEEWMADKIQEDVQINALLDYIEETFYALSFEYSLSDVFRIVSILIHYLEDKPDRLFNYLWSKYDNYLRHIFELSIWELRQFIKIEIIGSHDTITIEEYDAYKENYEIQKAEFEKQMKEETYYDKALKNISKGDNNE